MNQIERHGVGGQGPQPLQGVLAIPRCFINVADGGVTSQGGDRLIVGQYGLRGPVDGLLQCPQTDRNMEDRVAEVLDETPRVPMHTGQFANECRQARAIAADLYAWHVGFEQRATPGTVALL